MMTLRLTSILFILVSTMPICFSQEITPEQLAEMKTKMEETTNTGEPTEWQMKFACEYEVMRRLGRAKDAAKIDPTDTGSSLMYMFGAIANEMDYKLTSYRKIACEKSLTRPGYVCDYAFKQRVHMRGNESVNTLMDFFSDFEKLGSGRFIKTDGIWRIIEIYGE